MSEIRTFYYPEPLHVKETVKIGDTDFHHIKNVLRLKENDVIVVLAVNGKYWGKIISFSNSFVSVSICDQIETKINLPILHLIQGIPKGWKMDEIVEKSTEMGVDTIFPVYMSRSIAKYSAEEENSKLKRWEKIAISASKQSRRDKVPKIMPVTSFDIQIDKLSERKGGRIVFWELETNKSLADFLRTTKEDNYLIVIGPEGGISHEEVSICQTRGFTSLSLGNTILRTETAAPFAIGLTSYLWNTMHA